MNITVAMFCRMGLDANLEKTKVVLCTSRFIWGGWVETVYKRRVTGKGENFRDRKKIQVI